MRPLIAFLLLPLGTQEPELDDWFVIRINNQKSGFTHIVRKTAGDVVRTESTSEMSVKRMNQSMTISEQSIYEETPDGRLIRFVWKRKLSDREQETRGEVRDGKLVLNTGSIDYNPAWVFPAGDDRLIREKTGKVTYKTYSPEFGKPVTIMLDITREENGIRVRREIQEIIGVVTHEERSRDGRLLRQSVAMMGLQIVSERSDPRTALLNERGEIPEVFAHTLIRPRQKLHDARKLREAVYRVTLREGRLDPRSFSFEGQTIERTEDSAIILRVRHRDATGASLALPLKGPEEFLKPNETLQSDDPQVIAAAREAVGNETDALRAARRIEQWVFRNMEHGNLGVGFATAREALERRTGDCTEHAVLVAALCRAVGIPSRVAVGLAYANGAFGGHMWAEAWVGEWVPLDAAFGEDFVDATHIKMGESSLNVGGVGAEFVNVLVYLGKLDLDILEQSYSTLTPLRPSGRGLPWAWLAALVVIGAVLFWALRPRSRRGH